ncbi:hypothetical protein ACFYP4_02910 [Streptomyces sp. NPDC005551]|uniref:hypothetical protein n=1 Tax=Streptomyces sp. NPDC005551 TaxID=3364725 RepID=UPI0036CDC7DA
MNITAKALVTDKRQWGEGEDRGATIGFGVDYADDRNREWAYYTPSLSVQMSVRGDVADHFEIGQPFTLTFTPESAQEGE